MCPPHPHERRFRGESQCLRTVNRLALLEPERVVSLSLEGAGVDSVLDVGTGTGLFAEAFARRGARATGLDVNLGFLAIARRHAPRAGFVEGAAEALPFDQGSFDLVFLGQVLHETDHPLQALAEAGRVARIRSVVLEWPYREEDTGPPLHHRLSRETIEDLAAQAGFRAVERIQLSHMDLFRLAR